MTAGAKDTNARPHHEIEPIHCTAALTVLILALLLCDIAAVIIPTMFIINACYNTVYVYSV